MFSQYKVSVCLCAPAECRHHSAPHFISLAQMPPLWLRRYSNSLCTIHFAHMPVLVLFQSMSARHERAMSKAKSLALYRSSSSNCCLDTRPRYMVFARLFVLRLSAHSLQTLPGRLQRPIGVALLPSGPRACSPYLVAHAGTPR